MKGKIIVILFILLFISIIILQLFPKKQEGLEYYSDEPYDNTKIDCQNFCKKLTIKGDKTKCSQFNDHVNIKCYDKNNNLKSPLCEYVEKKDECRYNETYNKTLKDIINIKPPWGIYDAKDWVEGPGNTGTLKEKRGNGRDAMTEGKIMKGLASGNGALRHIPYIMGGVKSTIEWPEGSIPEKFTICSITRYTGVITKDFKNHMITNKSRILTSSTNNWLHGHWNNKIGMAYYEGWKTNYNGSIIGSKNTDWLIMCGKNGSNMNNLHYNKKENTILGNSKPIGTEYNGEGGENCRLSINKCPWGEKSDWALSYVIIWDQVLTDNEMMTVSNLLQSYLKTGNLL